MRDQRPFPPMLRSLAVIALLGAALPGSADVVPPVIGELLGTYCVSCHGPEKSEGELRLDRFATEQWSDLDLLEEILVQVEDGEMPPRKAKRALPPEAREQLKTLLTGRVRALDRERLPGSYKKVTAQEYSDSLADVFGVAPRDLSSLPFDSEHVVKKLGEHQVVTSYAVKKYYQAAREYLDENLIHDVMEPREISFTAANGKDLVGRQYTTTQGALAGGGNPPIFILKSPVKTFADEGEYELVFDWICFYGDRSRPEEGERVDPVRPPTINYHRGRTDSTVLNPVKVWKSDNQFLCGMDAPIRIVLNKEMKFLSFRGPDNGFKNFDREDPRYLKLQESDLPKDRKRAAMKALGKEMMQELHGDRNMWILIRGATFRGPLNKPETGFNKRLFGEIKRTDPIASCRPLLEDVARRLFRRPVPEELFASYYNLAEREHAESGNCYQAVKAALNAMLCSPHFLFKYEGDKEELDDYMIASRLSYFLWNSGPDDELLELAAAGRLRDPAVRREQAERLLADRARSDRFTGNFTRQWLRLARIGDYSPNEAYLPARLFTPLKPHLEREPVAFFNELLHGNLSALNFIHSDFVVLNQPLLSHYQRSYKEARIRSPKKWEGEERLVFRRMEVSEDSAMVRGGLVTMPAIMSLTTDGENTQPILRGVWIARALLGMEIDAPSSVPAIEVNLGNVSKPREILARHKVDPSCASCHLKFDHFGLAMEHFDVIGRWKTEYVHPVQDEKGRFQLATSGPIDARAESPDGDPVHGVAGVKRYLLKNRDTVMENLVRRLFSYALGRELRYQDRPQVGELLAGMKDNEYRLRGLVLDLVASEGFIRR